MSKTALITGATVGIGYELAKCFAGDGCDLVLVARNEERLNAVKRELEGSVSVRTISADLSAAGAAASLYDAVNPRETPIDYLVNNAGYGLGGKFSETDLDTELNMIQLNVSALVSLTKFFLADMVKRGNGRIVNVASTAAFQPGPNMSVYCATKAFVLSFSEAIASELAGSGVTVTAVCPGPTATEFQARADIEEIALLKSGMMSIMKPDEVARQGYRAMMKGKRVVVTGAVNKVGVMAIRATPRTMAAALAGKFMEK